VFESGACMPGRFILFTDLTQIHTSVFMPNDLRALCKEFILHHCLQLFGINTALLMGMHRTRAPGMCAPRHVRPRHLNNEKNEALDIKAEGITMHVT
jgi:hypothetical protein